MANRADEEKDTVPCRDTFNLLSQGYRYTTRDPTLHNWIRVEPRMVPFTEKGGQWFQPIPPTAKMPPAPAPAPAPAHTRHGSDQQRGRTAPTPPAPAGASHRTPSHLALAPPEFSVGCSRMLKGPGPWCRMCKRTCARNVNPIPTHWCVLCCCVAVRCVAVCCLLSAA